MSSVTVDDSDTSRLNYGKGQWFTGGSSSEFNGTTHGSFVPGGTVSFKFNGTSVSVYGTIGTPDPDGPASPPRCNSTYQVDSSSATAFSAPIVSDPVYNVLYYRSPDLADREHTLVVTANCTSDAPWYWLDYVTYVPSAALSVNNASTTSSTSPSLSSSSNGPAEPTETPTTSSVASRPSNGVIAAAVVVPLFLILFLILGTLWWKRRHQWYARSLGAVLDDEAPQMSATGPQLYGVSPFTEASTQSPVRAVKGNPTHLREHESQTTEVAVRQHMDGGVRLSAGQEPIELPPVYGQY